MIEKVVLKNIGIEDIEESLFIPIPEGKILKVYADFHECNCEAYVKLMTNEMEEIAVINNNDKQRVFYPRCNITEGINTVNNLITEKTQLDYYYFTDGLVLIINKNNKAFTDPIIKELRIYYEVRNTQPVLAEPVEGY